MITDNDLQSAEQKIANQIGDQCSNGAQSQNLGPQAIACGQFFGDVNRRQRGLHGTAAALRVIADSPGEKSREIVSSLVGYLENREVYDLTAARQTETVEKTFADDENNVIKLSEVLYSLRFVLPVHGNKEQLVSKLVDKLVKGYREGNHEQKGWSHFLTGTDPIDPLPTAFAVLALSRNGYEQQIAGAIDYIKRTIFDPATKPEAKNFTETSVRIFCLYALVFRKENPQELTQDEFGKLRTAFEREWRNHEALLDQDLEQNIEYSNGARNFYVRIPWQLYLLGLAAYLSPWRIYSFSAQRKLKHILSAVQSTGFSYPYSGSVLSTRTNAILYDTLKAVRLRRKYFGLAWLILLWDRFRTFFGLPIFRALTLMVFLGASGVFIMIWVKKGTLAEVFKGLGEGQAVALVGFFIASLIQSLRKHR